MRSNVVAVSRTHTQYKLISDLSDLSRPTAEIKQYKYIIIVGWHNVTQCKKTFGLTVEPCLWLDCYLAHELPSLSQTSYRCSEYITVLGTVKAWVDARWSEVLSTIHSFPNEHHIWFAESVWVSCKARPHSGEGNSGHAFNRECPSTYQ